MKQEDLRKEVRAVAIRNFKNGLNCAESIYDALIETGVINMPKETMAMCTGFGGGVGLTGHICGALAAAVMANGAKHGRNPGETNQPAVNYYRRYNKMVSEFKKEHGAVNCDEITASFGGFNSKSRRAGCMKLVGKTAALAYDILLIPQDEAFVMPYGENIAGLE